MRAYIPGIVCAALMTAPAAAGIVIFQFGGVVTSNTFTSGPWTFADPGDTFAVEFSFDAAAPDTNPDPSFGDFAGCISSSAVVAGTAFELGSTGDIMVTNSLAGDAYEVTLPLAAGIAASINLADATGTALSSDLLPTNLEFDLWLGRVFTVAPASGPGGSITGTITSFAVVPSPTAGLILGAGLLRAAQRRRRSAALTSCRPVPAASSPDL